MSRGVLSRPVRARLFVLFVAVPACFLGVSLLGARASAATYAPVAAYSFDEGEGSTVEDITGDGNDGTIEGGDRTTHGHYGGALSFDGSGECATVPASPALELREELTIEAWIRPEGTGEAESIVFKEAEGEWFGYTLFLGLLASGRVEGLIGETPTYATGVESPHAIPTDVWTHVALTYDGRHQRLYVDGELVDTVLSEAPIPNTGPLRIGCTQEHETGFDGRIDEVRIYDRVLGQADVAADMETPLQTPKSGPVAEYSFDEGEGTAVADASGNGNEGTVEGAGWAKGRYGGSLEFDGSGSCVSVPDSPSLQLSEEFTIETWVRPEGSFVDEPLILKEVEPGAGPSYDLGIGISEAGKPEGYAEGDEVEAPHELERGVWAHLAYTYDGGRMSLFLDGEQVASKWVGADTMEGSGPLRIGCWPGHEYAEIRIDEVRLYDRALNAGEVDADMEAPIQTPRKGPVADYSFDEVQAEGETQTVEDLSGDGHTATLHGATFTAHGRYGGALEFDAGKEAYVSIPADAGLDGHEELTVEAWVRPDESRYLGEIAMKEREGSGAGYSWTLGQHSSEPVGYLMQSEEGMVAGGEHSLPLHTWTHVAMTDDGAHNRLYVNGVLVDTAPAVPFDGHGPIKIGGNSLFGQWFDGRIDELRIYERALGTAEVDADMESPLQAPKANPVAEYSFDEDNGETVEDQAGENDGTVEGAEWTDHGRYGGAMKFDGEAMVSISGSEDLNLTEGFTLEAWVKPEAGCEFGQIFVKEDAEEDHAAYMVSKHGSRLGAYLGVPGVEEESPSGSLVVGAWQHIAVTFDGSKATLYVDGEEVGSAPVEEILSTGGDLRIGGSHIGSHGGGFVGRIDEVRIYNRGLDAAEVGADMEAPIQTRRAGPVAAWSFDEGKGTTVEDVTGHGHTATIEGAEWAPGKYGDALKFNGLGKGECATVPNSPALGLGEEFTIEAWAKSKDVHNEPIVFKEDGGAGSYSLSIGVDENGQAEALVSDGEGGEWEVLAPHAVELNVWTHLAVTYDGAHLRLYVDGELMATKAVAGLDLTSEGPLDIGCDPPAGASFYGRIDEVRLYRRALGTPEMTNFLDHTSPASVSGSGELAELASQYINGQGSKTVTVSATDDLSGIRSLALEDEGLGILASYTPTSCAFTSPHDDRCPREAVKGLRVNTARMPEGANHLQVVAEDLAGNVTLGTAWIVYVDRRAPGVASDLEALREPEESVVAVTWAEAPDPPLADGTSGSGASDYEYRYKVGEGSWSEPATSQSREFSIPLVASGAAISAEITATDLVGNRGNPVELSTTVTEADFTMEEPGGYTGENLEEIGFSNAPEPEDPAWAGNQAQPETTNGPITPADAFTENKCGTAPSPCGTYNGKEAAAYIRYWYKRRNGAYDSFGNDCVNFVNQALFAGGMKFERTDGFNDPTPLTEDYVNHYHKGEGSWWTAKIYNFGPPEWHWTESWSLVAVDHKRIIENGLGYVLSPEARLKKGDIVFYRFPDEEGHFHSDRPWTHAAMISNTTTKGIWVGQHTDDYERLLGDIYKKLDSEYGPLGMGWFIQFVRPTKTMYDIE